MTHHTNIHYYITAHGYGHGVRSCDIIRSLAEVFPSASITITTELPEAFLKSRLCGAGVAFRKASFDVGMTQKDSITIDLAASIKNLERHAADRPKLIESEAEYLHDAGASIVVCDIPSVPIEAAKLVGLPAIAVGNFSWDWIYDMVDPMDERWSRFARLFEDGYRKADALLRLPFHCPMPAFGKVVDVPLLAGPGRRDRKRLASLTGADPSKTLALLSFTTLDWDQAALERVEAMTDYEFFSVLPLEWPGHRIRSVDRREMCFSDLLATVDVVVTKPGFGIVSDCVANRKPMVYSERDNFAEFQYLVESIDRHLVGERITQEALYSGDLASALERIARRVDAREMNSKESVKTGGAAEAARFIADSVNVEC